jgi:hypothetical protein
MLTLLMKSFGQTSSADTARRLMVARGSWMLVLRGVQEGMVGTGPNWALIGINGSRILDAGLVEESALG